MSEHKQNPVAIVSTSRPKCRTCVNFFRDGPNGGHCRRFPPVPALVPQQTIKGVQLVLQSNWPPTLNDRYCGEHNDFLRWLSENREHLIEAAALDQAEAQPA
jgi:hypothetical protein